MTSLENVLSTELMKQLLDEMDADKDEKITPKELSGISKTLKDPKIIFHLLTRNVKS